MRVNIFVYYTVYIYIFYICAYIFNTIFSYAFGTFLYSYELSLICVARASFLHMVQFYTDVKHTNILRKHVCKKLIWWQSIIINISKNKLLYYALREYFYSYLSRSPVSPTFNLQYPDIWYCKTKGYWSR